MGFRPQERPAPAPPAPAPAAAQVAPAARRSRRDPDAASLGRNCWTAQSVGLPPKIAKKESFLRPVS